jgi:hypothetical protein
MNACKEYAIDEIELLFSIRQKDSQTVLGILKDHEESCSQTKTGERISSY